MTRVLLGAICGVIAGALVFNVLGWAHYTPSRLVSPLHELLVRINWLRLLDTAELTLDERRAIAAIAEWLRSRAEVPCER